MLELGVCWDVLGGGSVRGRSYYIYFFYLNWGMVQTNTQNMFY